MKIALAQVQSKKGDVSSNLLHPKHVVALAAANSADLVVFPELSLTNYEPALAKALAVLPSDSCCNSLQQVSEHHRIVICAGLPVRSADAVKIVMLIVQPYQPTIYYARQFLHRDEKPFFSAGSGQVFLSLNGNLIAPAICYESLLESHAETAAKNNASIYLASVAKSASVLKKHTPFTRKPHGSMPCMY